MKILDISPVIHEKTAVFPGDTPFSRQVVLDTKEGNHLTLSHMTTTMHLGAHADSTSHYHSDGQGIENKDLSVYLGQCQVVTVSTTRGARIFPSDIRVKIESPRVLFRTLSFPNPDLWNSDFNSLSPELIDELSGKGVILVGIDTPSVDPHDSKNLESHAALYRNKVSVLEGLVLDAVLDGLYTLVALPLKIKDADASPVRAVLLPLGSFS